MAGAVHQKRGASWGGEDRVCIRDEVAGSSSSPAPAPTENRVVGELGPEVGWQGLRQDRACSSKAWCQLGRGRPGFHPGRGSGILLLSSSGSYRKPRGW